MKLLVGTAAIASAAKTNAAMLLRGAAALFPPANTIPVSTLPLGNASANAYPGFTSPATNVFSSGGLQYLSPNPDNSVLVATTTLVERDVKVVAYPGGRCAILLRLSGSPGSQTCLFFQYNQAADANGSISIGIITGFDETQAYEGNGTQYPYYVNGNVATSPEGIAARFTNSYTNGDEFTFGVSGFTVYLQWNGVDLIRYTEWRVAAAGRAAIWTHPGYGSRDITVSYPVPAQLYSNPSINSYDTRDFGMRNVPAVTGSMLANSNQLVLADAAGFQVGDQIIVEIGGEAGGGLRNSSGVGGTWPTLSYANLTALNADTGQPDNTWAYLLSNGFVYVSQGGAWTHRTDGGGTYNQSYYQEYVLPQPLVAKVLAISANGETLTLSASSVVATTNANVWLDCQPSLFIINQVCRTESTFPPITPNVTINIPAGSWAISGQSVHNISPTQIPVPTNGYTVNGAGRTLTTIFSPKGTQCGVINFESAPNGCVISNMKYIGNNGTDGFGFTISASGAFAGYPTAFGLGSTAAASTGLQIFNVDGVNTLGACCAASGSGAIINNCTVTMNVAQRAYVGWQMQLADQSGGEISNCTATGTYLMKSFEVFGCNASKIVSCGGTNCLFSTNSSTSWEIDAANVTITANSYFGELSGSKDEPIFNVNDNAFGTGATGLISNPRCIQSGYINASNDSLKAIQISSNQTNVTVQGQYPGGIGCTDTLGGYFQAPDYNGSSGEYGSMAVYSDAADTIVSGIRVVGAAIGSPGHSSHWGNISLLGASSSTTNCVADVIQPGPTVSNNQTNAAYCP